MKPRFTLLLGAALWLAAAAGQAATSAVSPAGFVVTHRHELRATPDQVFAAIGRIERWWSGTHSYSGQAANLGLEMHAGGCWCERWDGNTVQHAQVIHVRRPALVRLQGGLGPLQDLPVQAVLSFAIGQVEGTTRLTVTYRVAGNADAALDKLAGPVDGVIGEATTRLVAYIESGKP